MENAIFISTYRIVQFGVKISGQIVEMDMNEVSLNMARLYKNINFNYYLLNNLHTVRIFNK